MLPQIVYTIVRLLREKGQTRGGRFPRYNNNNTNTSLTTSHNGTGSNTYYSWYSYGNYYTWAAAIANTIYLYHRTNSSGASSTSLCPTNWILPIGYKENNPGSFYYLNQQMGHSTDAQGSKEWRTFPNNFLYSGRFLASSADLRGSYGQYWSSTPRGSSSLGGTSDINESYSLSLDSGHLYPGDSLGNKSNGGSIRCLVDNTYTIRYDGNNATGGAMISDGSELKHSGLIGGETIRLYPSNYYKTGYGFAGWSIDPDAWVHFTDNDNTNDPIIYGPMETITAPAHPGHQKMTFYAVWVPAEEDGDNNPVYLQDFDSTSCSNLTSTIYDSTTGTITADKNSVVALTDKRDGNVYTVARLADGNCWMTENLRLEAESTVGNNQFDTSVTNESLAQDYGGVFIGLDSSDNSNFGTTNSTPNNLYNNTNITDGNETDRFPRYNNNNTNTALAASYKNDGDDVVHFSWYSYGNYYTWAAAMANTTYYNSSTGASGSESADTSICPTNWALPTSGGSTKDFGNLSQRYGGTGGDQNGAVADTMRNRFNAFPNNFLYSGFFATGSSVSGRGAIGEYWSKSAHNSADYYAFYFNFNSSVRHFGPSSMTYKLYGLSVRCLIHGS